MNLYRIPFAWFLLILLSITPSCGKKKPCAPTPECFKKLESKPQPVEKVLENEPVKPVIPAENPVFAEPAPMPVEDAEPVRPLNDQALRESPTEATDRLMQTKELPLEEPHIELPRPEDLIEFYFENADLEQLVKQIEDIYDITFITDDTVTPPAQGAVVRPIKGNKISFKTEKPLTKKLRGIYLIHFSRLQG